MKKRQRRGLRRGLSLILGAALLFTALPVTAAAGKPAERPNLEQSGYYAAGTNSVGRLLAGALEESAGTEGETGLSAVTVTGRTAQVSLHTAVGGTLLAAVYDEETQVMLALRGRYLALPRPANGRGGRSAFCPLPPR